MAGIVNPLQVSYDGTGNDGSFLIYDGAQRASARAGRSVTLRALQSDRHLALGDGYQFLGTLIRDLFTDASAAPFAE